MEAPTLSPRKQSKEDLIAGVGGSVLAHAIIFSLVLIVAWLTPKRTFQIPFYAVNLVSVQDIGMDPASGKGKSGPQAQGSKMQSAQKQPTSVKAKSAPLVPVKRLNVDEPVKRVESPLKKIDTPDIPKLAENSLNAASLDKNLEKLMPKPKVPAAASPSPQSTKAEGEKSNPDKETGSGESASKGDQTGSHSDEKAGGKNAGTSQTGSARGSMEGSPGGAAEGAQIALARRLYYTAIWNAIRQNWALPEFLKAQKLEAILVLVVRRDGKVLDLQFEKRSGQPLFDESVERAVRKSEPLPPFPEIYSPAKEEIGLRFRPEDIA